LYIHPRMKIVFLIFFVLVNMNIKAQIPVSQEPYHRVVYENDRVRILNVLLPPGDTTQYHVHSTPSVFIGLSTSHPGSQLLHQKPAAGLFTASSVFFEDLRAPHTRIHRVWNSDSFLFHVMDVELLSANPVLDQPGFKLKYTRLETDTTWVRIYKTDLPKVGELTIHDMNRRFLLVVLGDTKTTVSVNDKEIARFLSTGDFFWINPGDKFSIMNRGASTAPFTLLEVD